MVNEPKLKKVEIDGKTVIKCGNVEITDNGKPYTTQVKIDGKVFGEAYIIQSFKYEVIVQKSTKRCLEPGKHRLTLEYYPRSYAVKKGA